MTPAPPPVIAASPKARMIHKSKPAQPMQPSQAEVAQKHDELKRALEKRRNSIEGEGVQAVGSAEDSSGSIISHHPSAPGSAADDANTVSVPTIFTQPQQSVVIAAPQTRRDM